MVSIKKEKVTPKKPSAKRSLSFKNKDSTDASLLMETIAPTVEGTQSPAKTVSETKSTAPLVSAGTVRLG